MIHHSSYKRPVAIPGPARRGLKGVSGFTGSPDGRGSQASRHHGQHAGPPERPRLRAGPRGRGSHRRPRAQRVASGGSGLPTSAPFRSWNRRTWQPRVTPSSPRCGSSPGRRRSPPASGAARPPPAPEADTWRLAVGSWATPRRGRHQAPTSLAVPAPPGPEPVMDSAPVARSAALYEFLISAVEKAIFRQSRGSPDPAPAVYTGWARRNRPKCGTVNAIRPRSEL